MAATKVSYYPLDQQTADFWKSQQVIKQSTPQVPDGFPEQLLSSLAWSLSDIETRIHDLIVNLEWQDIEAIEAALFGFEAQSLELSQLSPETFVLPVELAHRLKQISHECYNGSGFGVIHGLDPSKYTPEQNVTLYAGLAAHVAPQRGFLDRKYQKVLCHVVNAAGANPDTKESKSPGFTNGPLSFHTDGCEILALYALDVAPEGGRTLVASSWQLYNELATKRPDVLKTLADNWVLDTFRDHSKFPPVTQPFLHHVDEDKVAFRFSRYPATGFAAAKRDPSLPVLSPAQVEALDAVHFMAAENAVALPMGKGDIAFINDMALLHARESFNEGGAHLKRHLLKLYLRDPEQNWPVPPTEADYWKRIYGPNQEDGTREEGWYVRYEPGQEDDWLRNG